MFERIAAIDIGTSSVKVVAVKTGLRDFKLQSLTYEEVDPSIENHTTAVAAAITKIIHEEDLAGYTIITNLPMEKEIIRNISFPFSDVEKIADAIPYEAEENIPFKLDDMVLDFLPLKSGREGEGRILLAAAHKETVLEFLSMMDECSVRPMRMGMESIALFECYRYFNRIGDEAVIQIDIGNNKTIVNIVQNNQLLFTRSITIGINLIHDAIAEVMKLSAADAIKLFHRLNLDLTTFENNAQREHYKALNLTRSRLKKIFDISTEVVQELHEQVFLTIKALSIEYGNITFNRILLSGGGSNITGLGTVLSREFEIPVVAIPFLESYKEQTVRTQFPIAFGTILSYTAQKRMSINFLKGEFLPDVAGSSRKIYYLAGTFAALTVIVLLINFVISMVSTSRSHRDYDEMISKQYRRYFNTMKVPDDPIAAAAKQLDGEKRKLDTITSLLQDDSSILDMMKEMIDSFPRGTDFELKNMVIQQHVMRIDGLIGSSKVIDDFKDSLLRSKKFDHVSVSITGAVRNNTRFTITIKQKSDKQESRKKRER
ncbi:MAG: pilus assembly protein PilM [Spirochaetes bacterium]|nr:pilus assembly protein PilM [Spirochaetota bacterium]